MLQRAKILFKRKVKKWHNQHKLSGKQLMMLIMCITELMPLPGERYLRRMTEISDLSSRLLLQLPRAVMVRGQCDAGEKSGYDCWPSSMMNPITSIRPNRQVKKHFPRKHRV